MIKLFVSVAAVALLSGCASQPGAMASAQTGMGADTAATAPTGAMAYVTAAGASDLFEIQSSQVALQQAKSADVRAFAQMMIDHHTRTSADLMAAAQKAGLNPPPPALTADKAARLSALQAAGPTQFDAMYLREQVAGHQEALALHTAYAQNGDTAALRAAATKTAPIVRSHLERAQTLAAAAA
jgi:putative membrane protein